MLRSDGKKLIFDRVTNKFGEEIMRAPIIAAVLAVVGGLLLTVSAFLGVTPFADWTMFGAETCLVLAAIVFLGWFFAGCVEEIRNA
jgi:hypothetical protein